jgi:uncharacterized protein DUF262
MATNLKNGGFPLSATDLIDSLNPKQATSTDPTILTPSQLDWLQQGEPEIDEVLEEDDENVPFQYAISTSGTDYAVSELVKRLKDGDIIIPKFQRGYVWSLKEASRFIESLLFGLPVPNIFLSVEQDTQRLLVVDGRQRLSTLQYFFGGIWPLTKREFAVKGTGDKGKYEGMTYKTLPVADRRRLNNAVLRASIIKQEQPSEDNSSIYHVFERLNTSGVSLTPQEIRAAIYHGDFSDLVNELNKTKVWREVYGPENRFMRDQELILRFFALYFNGHHYTAPMKEFLNKFMASNRDLSKIPAEVLHALFVNTVSTIYSAVGRQAFRPARTINTAVFDAVMVGVARRLSTSSPFSIESLKAVHHNLLSNQEFLEITQHSTGHPTNVERRLQMATDAFASVQ